MRSFYVISSAACILGFTNLTANRDAERVCSQLLIGNYVSACQEGKEALKNQQHCQVLWEAYILALSKSGDEQEMLKAWKQYTQFFPEQKENRQILENMAWGVIEKGIHSDSPITRLYSILGAFFGQDSRGVEILFKGMNDDNDIVRGIAVKVSSGMQDAKLKDKVLYLLRHESNWKIRLEAILAAGKMEIAEAEHELIELLSNDLSSIEIRAAAFQALVFLLETPEKEEVIKLAKSDRADLRVLACKVIGHAEMQDAVDLVIPLIQDHNPRVREEAIRTIGILRSDKIENVVPLLKDTNPQVAITAAWVMTMKDPVLGQEAFRPWLNHSKKEIKRLAAAALSATGKYGYPLVLEAFEEAKDPYVKMNLALGMIGQRIETEKATQALFQTFASQKENWSWDESFFKSLVPSNVNYQNIVPNYPEAINLATRLDILNILAMMNQLGLQDEVKKFLNRKTWGITVSASALLLTEGDESAIALVQNLLKDSNPKIKVQAALILSLWGGGEQGVPTLLEAYHSGDREMKEMILDCLGNVGSYTTIPFFVERLGEPYPTLRIIAAASLLKTLYH
jgi:HEAT repeat protein